MAALRREGDVFVLDLGEGENRFNGESLDSLEQALEDVEAASPCALVTTASGKIYSNGLDLEWIGTQGEKALGFVSRVQELLARIVEIEVPTIAALQGHAFAAGAMLALAHDRRVMRVDRGFFCLPEVDMGVAFTPGMSALIAAKLAPGAAQEAMLSGRRYGGGEALAAGIVDEAVSAEQVLPVALAWATGQVGKNPATLRAIKQRLHEPVLEALRGPLGI